MPFQRKRLTQPLTPDEALAKLEYFCAYRERCSKEVRTRMTELGMRGADAEQIFEVLQQDGFVDDERFAIAYAGGKFRVNHWGRVRIRMELRMRNIDPVMIQQALDAIDPIEYETVLQELLVKKKLYYAGDESVRDKSAAALLRAGFEPELVFRYL